MIADTIHTEAEADAMARYGITCVAVPRYAYKSWQYAKLSDAVAQARREEAAARAAS